MQPSFESAQKRLEQIKAANNLFAKNNNNQQQSDKFFKPSEEKKIIRILPRSDWPTPFFESAYHFNLGGKKIYCPQKNMGEDCPICDFFKKLRLQKDPKAQPLEARWAYTAIVLERKKDGSFDKPKLWTFSSGKIYEDFISYFNEEDFPLMKNYTSFGADGYDFRVQKVQNTNPKAYTTHRVECAPFKPSVLSEDPDVIASIKAEALELESFFVDKLMKPQTSDSVKTFFEQWMSGDNLNGDSELAKEKIDEITKDIQF